MQFRRLALALPLLLALSAAKPIHGPAFPDAFFATHLSCALPAPASFIAIRTDSTIAWLEWSPVSGAVSYSLKVYDMGTNMLIFNIVQQGSNTTINGLEVGKNYRAILGAMCSEGSISEFVIVEDIFD